jgi:uncharacterized protein with PIN domain
LILYLDSSALVKLFAEETGSELVRAAVDQAARSYTHLISYAEVRAALARALREGRETPGTLKIHKQELDALWLELRSRQEVCKRPQAAASWPRASVSS